MHGSTGSINFESSARQPWNARSAAAITAVLLLHTSNGLPSSGKRARWSSGAVWPSGSAAGVKRMFCIVISYHLPAHNIYSQHFIDQVLLRYRLDREAGHQQSGQQIRAVAIGGEHEHRPAARLEYVG